MLTGPSNYQNEFPSNHNNCAGAEDPRCPLDGLSFPISTAIEAYKRSGFPENFKVIIAKYAFVDSNKSQAVA